MSADIISSKEKHEGDITCICFQNNLIYTGGADGKINVWDCLLNLKQSHQAHETYIYAMVFDSKGKLYSSSCDGVIKVYENPETSLEGKEIVRCEDYIESLAVYDDILYSGDDKGVVTMWVDGKIKYKYNLVEEVRSLLVQKNLLYTVCDKDVVITALMEGVAASGSGKYMTKATIEGKNPVAGIGSVENGIYKYIAFPLRDGKGYKILENNTESKFRTITVNENAHEMIINALAGNDKFLYTAAWDGIVKKWGEYDKGTPKLVAEVNVGSCINAMICSVDQSDVYVGSSDGVLRKIKF